MAELKRFFPFNTKKTVEDIESASNGSANVQTVVSSDFITADVVNNIVVVTALAVDTTIRNPTGSFTQGQKLVYRIKDNATLRNISFGSKFRSVGCVLPNQTIPSKTIYLECYYNSNSDKFDVVNVSFESFSSASYLTEIVEISSAQILAMGTTPIELLPAPGVGKYYDIDKIRFEFTYGTIAYILADPYLFISQGSDMAYFSNALIIEELDSVHITKLFEPVYNDPVTTVNYAYPLDMNFPLSLYTVNNTDPTIGDGTMRAVITYAVRVFGE